MDAEIDAYQVLQVRPDAAATVIQAAYRALARLVHPDAPGGGEPHRMAELNRAYALVGDAERRAAYDRRNRLRLVPKGPGPGTATGTPDASAGRAPADANVLDFGRYAGWALELVARRDPDYLRWLSRHSSGVRYRARIAQLLPGEALDRRGALTFY